MTLLHVPPTADPVGMTRWTKPFWDGIRRHEIRIPRCGDCGTFRMPPGPFCPVCRSQEVNWFVSAGLGTIYSYTVTRHALTEGYKGSVPYAVGLVELDDAPGVRLIANLVGDEDAFSIGLGVCVVWSEERHGIATAPVFGVRKEPRQ